MKIQPVIFTNPEGCDRNGTEGLLLNSMTCDEDFHRSVLSYDRTRRSV